MALPLARNTGGANVYLPNSQQIKDIFKFCALSARVAPEITAELMSYFLAGYEKALKDAKVFDDPAVKEMFAEVKSTVDSFVDSVANGQTTNYLWGGQELPSVFQNVQQRLADAAAKLIHNKQITLDYAISDLAQFLRAYTEKGQPVDATTMAALDESFNAWLAQNQLISKGGVIYEADKDGNIQKDTNGNMVRTTAEKLAALIVNAQTGFGKFMQRSNESVQILPNRCSYPEEKAAPGQQQDGNMEQAAV